MRLLAMVIVGVSLFYYNIIRSKTTMRNTEYTHNRLLETSWTFVPLIIVRIMSYCGWLALGENETPPSSVDVELKIIGQMWYWTYEQFNSQWDSTVLRSNDYCPGVLRYLDVDSIVSLPAQLNVKLNIYSLDVIHRWSLMQLGIKMDAVPGRGNSLYTTIIKPGMYYGFCSELCGDGHSMMPIVVQSCFNDIQHN